MEKPARAHPYSLYSISVENWSVAPVANAPGSWPFWVLPEGY